MVTLSVLDQSPIRKGGTAAQALCETIELARLTDRLGFHRYWLAEHHGSGGLACSSPEVMIGQVAANTTGIRVGSGGVMRMDCPWAAWSGGWLVTGGFEALAGGLALGLALWVSFEVDSPDLHPETKRVRPTAIAIVRRFKYKSP